MEWCILTLAGNYILSKNLNLAIPGANTDLCNLVTKSGGLECCILSMAGNISHLISEPGHPRGESTNLGNLIDKIWVGNVVSCQWQETTFSQKIWTWAYPGGKYRFMCIIHHICVWIYRYQGIRNVGQYFTFITQDRLHTFHKMDSKAHMSEVDLCTQP